MTSDLTVSSILVSSSAASPASDSASTPGSGTDAAFTRALETASASQSVTSLTDAQSRSDMLSGRLGIDYKGHGFPCRVNYFDEEGQLLTTSGFSAESILELTRKFDIPLSDLKGLGEQLDQLNIGYRPYELYPGTGSDHGIDFDDLINGGLGTAYDWRKDDLVHLKGPGAEKRLEESQQFAQTLGLKLNPQITKV